MIIRTTSAARHVFWLSVLVMALAATAASAQAADDAKPASEAQELFAPKHVAKLKSVISAAVSPDGKHAAYTLAVQRKPLVDDDGPAWVELHVIDEAGNSRPFVTGKVNVSEVQWTPDGRGIAFVTKRGDDKYDALYVVPLDGGEARQLVSHGEGIHGAAFSPDGKQVAFLATVPRTEKQQQARDKGFTQEIYEEDWQPTKVWLAPVDGSSKPRALELDGSASFVEFSPDGHKLAVVLAPTPLVDDSYMYKRVSVVDAETGKLL
jgi:Tol biopolymer transport system component